MDEKTGNDTETSDWALASAGFQKELENLRVILFCIYSREVTNVTIYYQKHGSALKETCEECGKVVSERLIDKQWGQWGEISRTGVAREEEKTKSIPQYKAPNRRGRGGSHVRAPGQCSAP